MIKVDKNQQKLVSYKSYIENNPIQDVNKHIKMQKNNVLEKKPMKELN